MSVDPFAHITAAAIFNIHIFYFNTILGTSAVANSVLVIRFECFALTVFPKILFLEPMT